MKLTNQTAILVGALVSLVIVAVLIVSITSGSDPEVIIRFFTTTIAPIVTMVIVGGALSKEVSDVKTQVGEHSDKLDMIEKNTNGALTALVQRVPASTEPLGVIPENVRNTLRNAANNSGVTLVFNDDGTITTEQEVKS